MSHWFEAPLAEIDLTAQQQAEARQGVLTKPPGSLGQLEQLAIKFAGWQGTVIPELIANKTAIAIFAADHGVAAEGVSAFPQIVTVEMVKNFARGGAAICVLAGHHSAALHIINAGTANSVEGVEGVVDCAIAKGTANFANQPAMTDSQCLDALAIGQHVINHVIADDTRLFIGGEMGIANTTSASAVCCALLNIKAVELAGAGTGLDERSIMHKAEVIAAALQTHSVTTEPLDVLRKVGGFEIAALAGAYIAAAQKGIPSLVDGFIATSSALLACRLQPELKPWLLFSHQSAEKGHQRVLAALEANPLLSLGMRLGEGSGAAMCLPIIDSALALHANMATFEEAEVQTEI
ncbi:nicotinate-nucleotide--dimethylbenzimidazole phosphoribosyltransferase [Alkalimarinus alittae]|uniref:Nicotinate-nucleotide--dimethylbenzimidazole phosphoribosyltransferase n=1 Tax=Alkalimarinus alittae TaxID=2961619 RepID=A0ABY6N1K0_9ALTE|nr:nicotinate-nucleotide--dimethylbenzimidazole phosphoribosyltransferase [Alkalimarinus alittae]UZE95958.1 nicotinate-nucleotide--dimethylbenzimidazole phosphoribosyltransferase [Alkalimarinus alittae]